MSERQEIRPVGWTGPTGACVVAHWKGVAALDNHNPPRKYAYVGLEQWEWPPSDDGFVGLEFVIIGGLDEFSHGDGARWLLDDGETVRVMYSCGFHPEKRYIGLKTYTPSGRADDGPRTVYHLHIMREGE